MNIFSKTAPYFAAPHLANALNANLYVISKDGGSFFGDNVDINLLYCGENTENINDDHLIVIGVVALQKISKRIERNDFKSVTLILSDSPAIKEYKWWNEFVEKNNINLYIMPDLAPFCEIDYKPIYQFVEINKGIHINKPDKLIISHSPRTENKKKLKGTDFIVENINKLKKKYDFEFEIISGLNRDNAILEKSKSHIFIDQVIKRGKYMGGLGKSGLEAMILKCCVITSGDVPKTEPHFESPPIRWTCLNNFYNDIEELIVSGSLRTRQVEKQSEWIKKYNNINFFKNYLKTN